MKKKMLWQKAFGVGMIVASVMMIALCSKGKFVEDCDATAVLLTIPLGFYLLFSKKVLIY